MRVYVISFLGPHGSGKSTAANALYDYICERSYPSSYGLVKGSCIVRKAWESTSDVAKMLLKHGLFFYGDKAYRHPWHLRNSDALMFTQCLINEQQTNQLHNAIASLADEVGIPDDVPRFVISSRSCDWVAYYVWWKVLSSFFDHYQDADSYEDFAAALSGPNGIEMLYKRYDGIAPYRHDLLGLLTCSIYARPFIGLDDGIEFAETVHVMLRADSHLYLFNKWLEEGRGNGLHPLYSHPVAYGFLNDIIRDITKLFTESDKASWLWTCLLAEPYSIAERKLLSCSYSEKEIHEMAKEMIIHRIRFCSSEYPDKKAITKLWSDLDKLTTPSEY